MVYSYIIMIFDNETFIASRDEKCNEHTFSWWISLSTFLGIYHIMVCFHRVLKLFTKENLHGQPPQFPIACPWDKICSRKVSIRRQIWYQSHITWGVVKKPLQLPLPHTGYQLLAHLYHLCILWGHSYKADQLIDPC